ncbi:MAG TPA: GNAT family N-acetyltransferase [Kofleriaceae bacterium]|nr:GNAT family N-acetyltransferase [Kofleriaceae bacterium]
MIRAATADDYDAFAGLFPQLGVEDPTPTRERWVTDLVSETLVSERAGSIDGYISFYTLSAVGYVRNLVVAPGARQQGIGGELMRAAASALRERGVAEWHLNVKRDNAAAIRLYESLGMRVEHRTIVLRLAWTQVPQLPAEPAVALPVAPDEDDDVERALGMLAGRIAMGRKRSGRVQLQLRDETCAPVGYATFDPMLGAMPFRVLRPALARTLLEALRPHASQDTVRVVCDDDVALEQLLIGSGAETVLELLHYRGRVPCVSRATP